MQTVNYTDIVRGVASRIGVAREDLASAELAILNSFFQDNMREVWQMTAWPDICRSAEYRMPGNVIPYPNSGKFWTQTGVSVANDSVSNPIDAYIDACEVTDDTNNSLHFLSVGTSEKVSPTEYLASIFINRGTHRYFKLSCLDAANVETYAVFDCQGVTATSSPTTATTSIQDCGNGWYQCYLSVTPSVSGTVAFRVYTSLDGTNYTYTGAGKYWQFYAASFSPSGNGVQNSKLVVPWTYIGLDTIDACFSVTRGNPWSRLLPRPVPHVKTERGIQIVSQSNESYPVNTPAINVTSINRNQYPVFLHYRKGMPKFTGDTYSASTAYSVGTCVYYESGGVGNYYECLVAGTGNTPTNTAFWEVSEIPETFANYLITSIYADWLNVEGQQGKAAAVYQIATRFIEGELDKVERQNRITLPIQIKTHR